jgi:hypothetical protein
MIALVIVVGPMLAGPVAGGQRGSELWGTQTDRSASPPMHGREGASPNLRTIG